MSEFDVSSEDRLLAALRTGLGESDPVPADVSEFAKAGYSWRDVDARIAELGFDSVDEGLPSGVRSSATARLLTFQAGQWMLDVEFDEPGGRLIGAITPETRYTVDLHIGRTFFTTASDESGRFQAEGVTRGPLGMVLRFGDGQVIKTQWVVL